MKPRHSSPRQMYVQVLQLHKVDRLDASLSGNHNFLNSKHETTVMAYNNGLITKLRYLFMLTSPLSFLTALFPLGAASMPFK